MNEWTYTKSLYTDRPCDVWECTLPGAQILVFFEPGQKPLLCNTKRMISQQMDELPPVLYETYPHLCVADDVRDARLDKACELENEIVRLKNAIDNIEEHLDWLHPSNTPGWKRTPDYMREQAERIHDTAWEIEHWADDVDKWFRQ